MTQSLFGKKKVRNETNVYVCVLVLLHSNFANILALLIDRLSYFSTELNRLKI
jgi:hypothetical protein